MSCLLVKTIWTRTTDKDNPITMDDITNYSIVKSSEIKNNICNLTLKNAPIEYIDDTDARGQYVDSTLTPKFGEEDEIKIYAKFATDGDDIDSEWWGNSNLIGSFALEAFNVETSENSCKFMPKSVDSAFLLFNKVYNFSYGVSNKFTAPGIVRHCSRKFGEASPSTITTVNGTHNDTGTSYAINAKFLSEGGYITDYRSDTSTTLNETLTDSDTTITVTDASVFDDGGGTIVIDTEHISYTGVSGNDLTGCTRGIDDTVASAHASGVTAYQGFPLVIMSKIWKPLFEWIGEVSQTENTNYLSEITEGGTLNYNRAFIFYIDKSNNPHWFYPDDTVDLTVDLGEEGRRGFKLEKSVFDAVNFVIYNCGEDMYGNGILHYWFDENSSVSSLKMRYQPMTKIIHSLIDKDLKVNDTRDTTNQDIYKQFPDSGEYPISSWAFKDESNLFRATLGDTARSSLTNDADYNDSLREACKWVGLVEAKKITNKRTGLRYKGTIPLKGVHVNPGDLIQVTNKYIGLNAQLLRVINVNHKINQNVWETILTVEEDEAEA